MESAREPYLNPYLGGVLLGLVLFASFLVLGTGLGASDGLHRVVTFGMKKVAPANVEKVKLLAEVGGSGQNPLSGAGTLMLFGTFFGGLLSGLLQRRFKVELFKGPGLGAPARLGTAFLGGSLFGFGARMARGCTSGQCLTGGAMLSVGSFAIMFAIFGAGFAVAYPLRKLWN